MRAFSILAGGLMLASCQSETPATKRTAPFGVNLSCKVHFFKDGADTGSWSDGVLLAIKDREAVLTGFRAQPWDLVSVDFASITFASKDKKSFGRLNRLNGDLMLTNDKQKVEMTGDCVKAVQRF